MAKNIDDAKGPSGPVNVRGIVDEVFQGDVISKISQGSALKSLAYKTVKLTYENIIPPLDEVEAFFIAEQFMQGWLGPVMDGMKKQAKESKDEDKIRENTDFDKEDGVPDKIGEFEVLKAAKSIGQSHVSEVVAGTPLDKEERERLMKIKKKFSENGKSMTSTLSAVVDSPDYTNFIKHAITSAALYLNVDEPRKIRRQAKTGDFDEMGLALDDAAREREEESRPKVETEEGAGFSDKFRDMYKSDWFNLLKRDD
tara:strand:+ start:1507 stop:2271 length:765 start_codon:yes stop_codon:yes gene_type:complete